MRDAPLLQVSGIGAGYGRSKVLFDVTMSVSARGGVAILGRNGAGKTTLLKAIMGELPLDAGSITMGDRDISREPTERRARAGIGYVPQEHAVFGRLSVRDNLAVGKLATKDPDAIERVLTIFPKLGQRLDQAAGTLSGGERKMLSMARAMIPGPRLLLLDEPTEGVWIGVVEEIIERLVALKDEMSVIVVEQHLDLALRVCDRAYVLDRGSVAIEGSSTEVRDHPSLLKYLAP